MTKGIKKKSSIAGKKENKSNYPSKEQAYEVLEKGNSFGDVVLGMMDLFESDWMSIAVATVGLAKALAALKDVANSMDLNIDELFESELATFEKVFNEMSEEAN